MDKAIELSEEMEVPAMRPARPIGGKTITAVIACVAIGYGAITARDYAVQELEAYKDRVVAERLATMRDSEFTVSGKGTLRLSSAQQNDVAKLLEQTRLESVECQGKLENIKGILQYGY